MAEFFQQDSLDLLWGGQLQPVAIDVDAFAAIGRGAGVGSDEAIDAGGIKV